MCVASHSKCSMSFYILCIGCCCRQHSSNMSIVNMKAITTTMATENWKWLWMRWTVIIIKTWMFLIFIKSKMRWNFGDAGVLERVCVWRVNNVWSVESVGHKSTTENNYPHQLHYIHYTTATTTTTSLQISFRLRRCQNSEHISLVCVLCWWSVKFSARAQRANDAVDVEPQRI